MSTQQVQSNSSRIERPTCPTCGQVMWIARIHPDAPGFEERTFECPVCDISKSAVVKTK